MMSNPSTPQWLVSKVTWLNPFRSVGETQRCPRTGLPLTQSLNMFSTAIATPCSALYRASWVKSHVWYRTSHRYGGCTTTTSHPTPFATEVDLSMIFMKLGPHMRRVTTSIGACRATMLSPSFLASRRGASED